MSVKVLSLIAALIAMPAVAQTAPEIVPAATAPAKPVKPAKPRKICRSVEGANSRITSSLCKTAEQWAADQAANDGHVAGNQAH